jgi:hypothetical protein
LTVLGKFEVVGMIEYLVVTIRVVRRRKGRGVVRSNKVVTIGVLVAE